MTAPTLPVIFSAENLALPQAFAQAMADAQSLENRGQGLPAEAIYRHLLAMEPGFHPAWHALGLLALNAGRLPLAAEFVARAVALNGQIGMYQRNLGEMLRRLGRLDEAIAAGQTATKLIANDLDAHYNLGLALADAKRHGEAVTSYRRALALNAGHGLSWNNLGSALEALGDLAGAEEAYATAVHLNPRHAEAQNNLGAIYSELGRLDDARRCFEAALAARPHFAEAHSNISPLKTYRLGDADLQALERLVQSAAAMTVETRIRFLFALAKAREDVGHYDQAFAAYAEGNRLQYALRPFDEVRADAILNHTMQVFDRALFERHGTPTVDESTDEPMPLFIVGMPRSGTSLLEQILATHPGVYGAGELKDLGDIVEDAIRDSGEADFPTWVAQASPADFAAIGQSYLARLKQLAPGATIITDKMPGNFFLIGVIRLALPRARIIHAMRDPMDSCFSCFSRLFNDSLDFSYDLGALGRYCVRYLKLMRHWQAVLPPDAVLDMRYEDMVADTEGQVRRLLDYLGLPWNPACLEFHKNTRRVKTASVAQVRKPIYKTSVARWKHFEPHLTQLADILRDWRD